MRIASFRALARLVGIVLMTVLSGTAMAQEPKPILIKVQQPSSQAPELLTVHVHADGRVVVAGKPISDADAKAAFSQYAKLKMAAKLSADRSVKFKRIVDVMDLLKTAGVRDIVFAGSE